MSQTIKLKRGTSTPTTSNIVSGEVAIDMSAQKLYINDSGTIKEIGGGLGSISVSDVPNLPASKITSGTFSTARIPNLAASKITSGTLALARLPTIPYTQLSGTPTIPSVGNGTITINAGGSLSGGGTFTTNQSGNTTVTLTGPTIPTSLPANGGNADTVDGLHAASFIRSDANDTTTGNITIEKTTPRILLKDNNTGTGSYPEIEFETANNQGVKLYHNEFDGELPASGYGLVLAESDTNTQFPTTGTLSFNVLGEMFTGGTTLSSLNKVFHDGYHPNADKWTTARSHTVTLTGDVTGSASQSVDGTGNKTWNINTAVGNDSHTHSKLVEDSAITFGAGKLQWTDLSGNGGTGGNGSTPANPFSDWHYHLIMNHANSGGYYVDIAAAFHSDRLHFRRMVNGTLNAAQEIFHDGYHPNADKWTTARSHTVTLTGEVTGTATQTVDGTGNKTWSIATTLDNGALNDQYVQQLPDGSSPDYQTPSSRRVNPTTSNPTNEHYAISTYGNGGNVTGQLATHFQTGATYNRAYNSSWSAWSRMFDDDYHPNADKLTTARTIAGTSFDGTANINISYNNLTNKPSIPSVGNGTLTVSAGTSLSGGGSFTANQSGNSSVTLNVATPSDAPASWQDVVGWNGALIKDTAVEIHGSGYLRAAYLNMTHGVGTRSSDTVFYSSNDDYIRKNNATGMRAALDIYTKGEVNGLIPTSLPANGGNADTVDGVHAHGAVRNNQANKLVRTDSNGYIQAGWINTTSGNNGTTAISRIYASQDGYIRYYTPANFGSQISSHINYDNLINKPSIPSVGNGTITINTSGSLSGSGSFTTNQSGNTTVTLTGPTIPTTLPASSIPNSTEFGTGPSRLLFGSGATSGTGVRNYFAPRNAGDTAWDWSNEFGYDHANSRWYVDGVLYAGSQVRTPIVYDHNNTSYYVNPADGNTAANFAGNLQVQSDKGLTTTGSWIRFTTAHGNIQFGPANNNHAHIYTDRSNFYFNKKLYVLGGSEINQNDIRSKIFYDKDNTSFYLDPASESVLGNVRANNFRVSTGNGKGIRFWNSDSYKIYMSATSDSALGGRAPYESTSDYNMYFRMNGGTNRGFVFRNNTTNVAGIDSAGNFNTNGLVKTGNGAASAPAYAFTGDYDSGMFSLGSNAIGFSTGGSQRFKVNSNGLLLTGSSSLWVNGQQTITSTRDIANVVNYQNTDGHMQLHRTGNAPLIVNRKGTTGATGTSRGEILNFKSANTKIGRIGYAEPYGSNIYFAAGDWGLGLYSFSSARYVQPSDHTGAIRDNQIDLGSSSSRFDDVYATNGTIQTSDRNQKQDIQELTDAETRAAVTCKGLMRRFRWVDSVEEKGDNARYHFGAIAQDVEAAFTAEGLDAGDYGLFIRSSWWEHEGDWYPEADVAPEGATEKTRLGIRYNQLFAFIIGAL